VQLEAVTKGDERPHPSIYLTCIVYALLAGLTVHRHEPWADEAHSWLLGRDASLAELWRHLLHYEGTPGLWQSCLHVLIRLGLPYPEYGYVPAFLSLAAVVLLLRYAPLPLFIRILLPFTYFLCYQYAVIARSYAFIAPLLFGIAVIYPNAVRKPVLTTALLCLLAGVSVHGFLISVCIWATLNGPLLFEWRRMRSSERRTFALQAMTYWAVLIFLLICAWPARDVAFAEHRGLANLYLLADVTKAGLAGAFTGYWITSLALIALSTPLLWRGGGWRFFLLVNIALFLFGTLVYAQLWHFGILFLAWLFAIWISAAKTPVTAPTVLALIIAIGVQCYWTASAIGYDWDHAYSGSLAAAQYLRQSGLPAGGLYAIGYPTVAVQPYFPANIYSNFHGGGYWDWSKRNHAGDPAALFASVRRELVLVGYKNLSEKQYWAGLLRLLGYGVTQHFEGRTFWQTGVFELESYDLYGSEFPSRASSSVNMADPSQSAQLLNGFYNIEGKSRWTARNFTVLLKGLPGSNPQSAELALKLYIPDSQIQKLGAITLRGEVSGRELPAQTFSQSSEYTYSARVPAEALRSGFAVLNFRLDKSSGGRNGDARDLGIVVTEVGLRPPSPAQ
jgi:hypothetical protein